MAEFIRHEGRQDAVLYHIGDTHCGSRLFHEEAYNHVLDCAIEEDAFIIHMGDCIEGKPVGSAHYDPKCLDASMPTIGDQIKYFGKLMRRVSDRILSIGMGNHESNGVAKDIDVMDEIATACGVPHAKGGYQTWVVFGEIITFNYHGRWTMPRGAKDPIQREANQRAWLKNRLEGLASAHAMYMGHTHHCLVQDPIQKNTLMVAEDNVRRKTFVDEPTFIGGNLWVHPDARFYANTGTFRRGGGFGFTDYSEIGGYVPPDVAYVRTEIVGGKVKRVEKVVV